ncbi:hypothetical protein NDI53_23760 [Leptolyngbya sp. NM3-A1]
MTAILSPATIRMSTITTPLMQRQQRLLTPLTSLLLGLGLLLRLGRN